MRAVVFGITLVILIVMLVSMIEYFVPLSAKFEFNAECRKAQLKMENEGGLSMSEQNALRARLMSYGFINVVISAQQNVKYGEALNLNVQADYVYSRVVGLYIRQNASVAMGYDKTTIARKVVN